MQEHGVSKNKARRFAYTWLSNQLGQQIHIGELDRQMCMSVIAVCKVQLKYGPFITPLPKNHGHKCTMTPLLASLPGDINIRVPM